MIDALAALYLVVVVLAAALAGIAVWAPRRLAVRAGAVVLAGLLVALSHAALSELLGRPKPTSLEWAKAQADEAQVLAADMRENVAIYLWLRLAAADEPRAYRLPWNRSDAEDLQKALREARRQNTGVRMRRPFERTPDLTERRFYAPPQPALPPKAAAGAPATVYSRPDPPPS